MGFGLVSLQMKGILWWGRGNYLLSILIDSWRGSLPVQYFYNVKELY